MMKNQQKPQWALFVFLSTLAGLFSFQASRGAPAVEKLSKPFSSELRAHMTFALCDWNWMLGIRVEKSVSSDVVSSCMKKMKKMKFLILAGLTAMSWLTTLESILQLKATDITGEKAYGSPSPYNDTPLVEPTYEDGHCAGSIPGHPKPPRIPSNTSKRRQQAAARRPLSALQLNEVTTTLKSTPALHGGTEVLEDMMQPKTSLPDSVLAAVADISVFQIMKVVTEAIGQPSSLTPIVLPTGSSTDDDVRTHPQTLTASAPLRPSETSTSPVDLDSLRTTIAIGDAAPSHLLRGYAMITSMPTPEASSPIADPSSSTPRQPYVPVTRSVSQLQPGDVFAVQSQGSMSAPTYIPTGQVNWSRGRSSESAHSRDDVGAECPYMNNFMGLNIGNIVRSDPVTETLSMNGEFSQDTLTPTTSSRAPNTSHDPSPVENINRQPYRPIFQPLSPPIERSVEVEQPWSPENPTTSARQDRVIDVVNKCDALFNTRTES